MLAEYRKRRDYVVSRLRGMPGVTIAEPRGAFYVYPNVSVGFRNGIASALQFSERLLAQGARMDSFCAAMLGQRAVLKAMLAANPSVATTEGPHGYTLLYHAAISGDVVSCVMSQPAPTFCIHVPIYEITAASHSDRNNGSARGVHAEP